LDNKEVQADSEKWLNVLNARFRWNSVLEGVFLKFLLKKSHYLNIFSIFAAK